MTSALVQLGYAKPPPLDRRKPFRRAVIAIALIAVAGAAWRWGPEKWERAKLIYWQWRCLNYSPPPDEIVFDQVPNGRSPLLNGSSKYVPRTETDQLRGTTTAAASVPECETNFANAVRLQSTPAMQPPILFMHERSAPSGRQYLVILRGDDIPYEQIAGLPLDCDTFTIANWRDDGWCAGGLRSYDGPVPLPVDEQIRIYAGQADPIDETHFTVRYIQNGITRIVDGYVEDRQEETDTTLPGAFTAWVKLVLRKPN
jgi:hypothetical protein